MNDNDLLAVLDAETKRWEQRRDDAKNLYDQTIAIGRLMSLSDMKSYIKSKNTLKLELRENVEWFATQMEAKLRNHDKDRGHTGWLGPDSGRDVDYVSRILDELSELVMASMPKNKTALINECIDVANFAMMLADRNRD